MSDERQQRGTATTTGRRPPPRRRWVLALVSAAFLVAVSDSTIVYTALPSIGHELDMSVAVLPWVVISFLLTSGALLLLGGRAADLIGRRTVFLAGTGLFAGMSLLAGLAWSPGVLILARTVQGLGVAAMVPAALSILTVVFPEGEERNRALGVWGALAGIGATAGLLLGGPITYVLGWRWVFLLNVPIGAAVLVAGPLLLPAGRPRPSPTRRFDIAGASTSTLALLALVTAIVLTPQPGTGRWPVLLVLAAAGLGVAFVAVEARAADPLLPLRLFRSRSLLGGNLVVLAAGISVDGLLFGFTVLAQDVLGYSAVGFGLAMSVMTAASFVGVVSGQHLVGRRGVGTVATAGLGLLGVGSLVLTRVDGADGALVVALTGLLLFGLGMGAAFVAGQIAALSGISPHDAGVASGVEETTFAVGSALGVALASGLVASRPDLLAGTRLSFGATAAIAAVGVAGALALLGGVGPPADRRSGHDPLVGPGGVRRRGSPPDRTATIGR